MLYCPARSPRSFSSRFPGGLEDHRAKRPRRSGVVSEGRFARGLHWRVRRHAKSVIGSARIAALAANQVSDLRRWDVPESYRAIRSLDPERGGEYTSVRGPAKISGRNVTQMIAGVRIKDARFYEFVRVPKWSLAPEPVRPACRPSERPSTLERLQIREPSGETISSRADGQMRPSISTNRRSTPVDSSRHSSQWLPDSFRSTIKD